MSTHPATTLGVWALIRVGTGLAYVGTAKKLHEHACFNLGAVQMMVPMDMHSCTFRYQSEMGFEGEA